MLKLYYFPISTSSVKVLSALAEKHMSVPMEIVNITNPIEKSKYREKYALGKVPLLVTESGELVPESSVIVEYFESYGSKLIPEDKSEALQARLVDRMIDFYLSEPLAQVFLERRKPKEQQNEEHLRQCHEKIHISLNWLNDHVKGTWLAGETFSIADCSALAPLYLAQNEIDLSAWPKIQAYAMRLIQRPSSRKVLEEVIMALNTFH